MSNPIFNQFRQKQPQNGNILQQFAQFKQMLGTNDPNAMINQLVSSGKVSQQQLEQAKQMASQFSSILK